MEKAVAILFICIIVAGLAISGCASRERGAPTTTAAAPSASATPTSPLAPTIAPGAAAANSTGLDPSLADISGEDDESLPELDIPTPSAE